MQNSYLIFVKGRTDMEILRATELWQKAAVYCVRAETMCEGFHVPFSMEFGEDKPEDEYILVMEGDEPVATCRLHFLDAKTGQIERVCTRPAYQGKNYGRAAIEGAEQWLRERGVTRICINSREAALGFYEKLGYTPDYSRVSGEGTFKCVMTDKNFVG